METKRGHFDPSKFHDRYEEALVELLKAKQAGRSFEAEPQALAPNVINLMDALKRSIAAEKPTAAVAPVEKPASPAKPKKASKRVAGQREMLLAIEGKGGGKEAAKSERRPAGRARKAG